MARKDGTPDSYTRLTDPRRDLNIDQWPETPEPHDGDGDGARDDTAILGDRAAFTDAVHAVEGGAPVDGDERNPFDDTGSFDVPVSFDDVGALDEADTFTTPSYDLGPDTESFTIDLTAPAPSAPAEPAPPKAPDLTNAFSDPAPARRFGIPPVPSGDDLSGADSLTADAVLKQYPDRPSSGWRRSVFSMTNGRVNLGPSAADRERNERAVLARTPIQGCHRLAVISLKGGVGKTTTTAALGAVFAELRGDRVIAVDANPDRGTLGERVPRESGATVRHLLDARAELQRYADVRAFTNQSPTRLEVLASDSDPSASLAFSEQDYRDTVDTLERFYNLILTDCGTGLLHSAMHGILGLADSLVVVSSASLDGARSASATLDWLEAHGLEHLAREAVVAISSVRRGGGIVDVLQLEDHFAARCRDVVSIPYDPHLEAGGILDLHELNNSTRRAYFELAAAVGEGFATD